MNVTSKGQVTIPKEIRDLYRIDETTEVDFVSENGQIILVPRPSAHQRFDRLRGRADAGLSTDDILRLTRGDDA